jgi:hypothetical protein
MEGKEKFMMRLSWTSFRREDKRDSLSDKTELPVHYRKLKRKHIQYVYKAARQQSVGQSNATPTQNGWKMIASIIEHSSSARSRWWDRGLSLFAIGVSILALYVSSRNGVANPLEP